MKPYSAQQERINREAAEIREAAESGKFSKGYTEFLLGRADAFEELAPLIGQLEIAFNEQYAKVQTTGAWL